jgi:hypothetical protein
MPSIPNEQALIADVRTINRNLGMVKVGQTIKFTYINNKGEQERREATPTEAPRVAGTGNLVFKADTVKGERQFLLHRMLRTATVD